MGAFPAAGARRHPERAAERNGVCGGVGTSPNTPGAQFGMIPPRGGWGVTSTFPKKGQPVVFVDFLGKPVSHSPPTPPGESATPESKGKQTTNARKTAKKISGSLSGGSL